jgi:glutamate carboxypeptidase
MDNQKTLENHLENKLDEYLKILQEMVSINTFSENQSGVNKLGRYTQDVFSLLGFSAEFFPSTNKKLGNHLFMKSNALHRFSRKPFTPTIAMISHLDTVFPLEEEKENDFKWLEIGDLIYGPGTVDIKGGTIMIYLVLDSIKRFYPEIFSRVNWEVSLNASEEILSDDFGEICVRRFPEKETIACLVFEGGNLQPPNFPLVISRKGRATFKIIAEGKSAHAGNNHQKGINAIHQIARTIEAVTKLTNYEHDITFNVGTVEGGTLINRVPHYAEAECEMRAFSPDVFDHGIKNIIALQENATVKNNDGILSKVTIKVLDKTSPWPVNPKTEYLFSIWENAALSLNINVMRESRGGLSDGNLLWEKFPTLDGLGPSGGNSHCSQKDPERGIDQEYILKSSIIPKALLNIKGILDIINSF